MINAYAAFEPAGELKPYQYDPGELKSHEVEIDVMHCGICHSDLSVIDSEWGKMPYPVVGGHEVVGKIAALGSGVTHLKIGDAVGLGWDAGFCNNCEMCDSGDQNLCGGKQPTIIGHYGGFADKVRAAANAVVAIPDGLDLQAVGPMFCGGITVFNPLVQFDIPATAKVAVIGIGGLGHMALQFLNAWGCEVTAFTSSENKSAEALSMGAHKVLNSRDPDELKAARGSFDVIFSTVNVTLDWSSYLRTLRPRGRLHFLGAATAPLNISAPQLFSGQHSISGSPVGSPGTIAKMLEFALRHDIKPIIETYAFDDINAAIDRLRSGQARYRVVLTRG